MGTKEEWGVKRVWNDTNIVHSSMKSSNKNIQNKMKITKATFQAVFECHSGICG